MVADTKMLQMVLDKVSLIDKKVDKGFKSIDKRFDETTERIDKIGLQLAKLEDDAPTREELEGLEKKVVKIQHHLALD